MRRAVGAAGGFFGGRVTEMCKTTADRLEAAFSLFDAGEWDTSSAIYEALLSEDGLSPAETAQCLLGYEYVLCALGRYAEAVHVGEKLFELAASDEERHIALHQLAMATREAGNYDGALLLIEEERKILDASFPRDALKYAVNEYEQGYLRLKLGRLPQAKGRMETSLSYAEQAYDPVARACAHRGLGEIAIALGQNDAARHAFQTAVLLFDQADDLAGAAEIKERWKAFL